MSSGVQEALAHIAARVLGVTTIELNRTLSDQGGDSLAAIAIASEIEQAFTIGGSPDVLVALTAPVPLATVAEEIASIVEATSRAMSRPVSASCCSHRGPMLLPEQEWFLRVARPQLRAPHHWNTSRLLRLNGRVDNAVLAEALREVWARHPALRTRLLVEENSTTVTVESSIPELETVRVGSTGDAERVHALAAEIDGSLDLESALAKVALIESGDEYYLLLVAHHMVSDRWSMDVLARELECLIARRALPPTPTSAFQWADHLRAFAENLPLEERLKWPSPDVQEKVTARAPTAEVSTVELDACTTKSLDDALQRANVRRGELWEALLAFVPQFLGSAACPTRAVHNGRTAFNELLVDVSRAVGRLAIRSVLPPAPSSTVPDSAGAWLDVVRWQRSIRQASFNGALCEWVAGARRPKVDISLNYLGDVNSVQERGLLEPVPGYMGHLSSRNSVVHDVEIVTGSWSPIRATVKADPMAIGEGAAASLASWLSGKLHAFARHH